MNYGSVQPQTETMAPTHNIRNITAGAIATCGVLVRSCLLRVVRWYALATCIDASTLLTLFLRLAGCFPLTVLFKK